MVKLKIFYDEDETILEEQFNEFCEDNYITPKDIVKVEIYNTEQSTCVGREIVFVASLVYNK